MHDYHAHSNYSDGVFLWSMASAAAEAGLDGIGFADHCNVVGRPVQKEFRATQGFNLDRTYERRRTGFDHVRKHLDVAVHDAVEMDYDPDAEERIASFLDEAGFDYAVGSVHFVGDRNVQFAGEFEDADETERQAFVDRYYDRLVALVESELFEVAAHLDLVERNEALAGFATRDHYERVADALASSRTVPEVNAGRVTDLGHPHPRSEFFAVLRDRDVAFTVGTDAHRPDEVRERADFLREFVDEHGLEPVSPLSV